MEEMRQEMKVISLLILPPMLSLQLGYLRNSPIT